MKTKFLVIFFLVISVYVLSQQNNPISNADAVIISDHVRITVLTPELIRLEWSENGKFSDLSSFVYQNRNLAVSKFNKKIKGNLLTIETDKLELTYKINTGKFNANNLSISFLLNGKQVKWIPGMRDTQNLKGTTRTLDTTDGEKDVKLEDGLLSKSGWFVHDDSKTNLLDKNNWLVERDSIDKQDWYFYGYGHEYKKALSDYVKIAGRIPMPPKYVFGYWWSRFWAYSDDELRKLVNDMQLHNMPLDVLIIDMDWHNTYSLYSNPFKKDEFDQPIGWTGYTWNKNYFQNPPEFLKWTEKQHIKTALNLHPASGIAPSETVYSEFAIAYNFDTTGRKNIPMKIEEKKWVDIYFDKVLRPIEKQGIDFWWLDWQQWLENKTIKNLSNTWWLNYIFFNDMEKNGKNRPFIFHRWGGMGNHRYPIGFSGDSHSSWDALDYQSYFTATASNVGYGYWSHDIGGHIGDDTDPELYLRWIQFGAFSPILRTHSVNAINIERRMYMYPAYFGSMLDALQMRYALNPYIYNASRVAYDTGISICRPMYYDYPEAEKAYTFNRQYMFGNDMIVAPIAVKTEDGLALKKVWLPEGDWYELYTGQMLKGNEEYLRNYGLNQIPVFVKSGTIIPMYPKTIKNLQVIPDTLVLCFVPGGNSETKIYDDDGKSSDYKNNTFCYTTITKKVKPTGEMNISILPTVGDYEGMPESLNYCLEFPSTFPPAKILVNGREYRYSSEEVNGCWSYNADKLTVKILIPKTNRRNQTDIDFIPQSKNVGMEYRIYGKVGMMNRLEQIVEKLKYSLANKGQFSTQTENITSIGSIKSRIRYAPENTLEILQDFDQNYPAFISDLKSINKLDSTTINELLKTLVMDIKILPSPTIVLSSEVSMEPVKVSISTDVPQATVYYSTDGSAPTEKSKLYSVAFELTKSSSIKARIFKNEDKLSNIAQATYKRIVVEKIRYAFPYSDRYSGSNLLALNDGVYGTSLDCQKAWIGFETNDILATMELKKPMNIKSITARFLENQSQWIFLPDNVTFEVSTDNVNYKMVQYVDLSKNNPKQNDTNNIYHVTATCNESGIKYIRFSAKNIGACPKWHYGAGGKAWLFTDELIIE